MTGSLLPSIYTLWMCVCVCACILVSPLWWLTSASLSAALPASSAVNSKFHSGHILRSDVSPTWHSRISGLTCWHAVSKREAREQSKLMLSREKERGYTQQRNTAVYLPFHPPKFRWGQAPTFTALRLATVFLEGSRPARREDSNHRKWI